MPDVGAVVDAPATRRYLERTVRTWLGVPADTELPQLPRPLARRFLRLEELERAHRSSYDCWEHSYCESYRAGTLRVPELDDWLAPLRDDAEPLWPSPHEFAVCFTHDVDLVSPQLTPAQVARSARAGAVRGGPLERLARPPARVARALVRGVGLAPSTAATLERCVDLELERGVSASYFFTVRPAGERTLYDCTYDPSDPCRFRGERRTIGEVAQVLGSEGFDVGLHGSYGAAGDPPALKDERTALRQATGLEIATTRQHFLHWHVGRTPHAQQEAGFRADSSLGFNRDVGFRAGTSLPHRLFDLERGIELRLLEVPLVVQDGALLGSYGLELDVPLALETIEELVARVARAGGLVTFLFHPDKLERPDYLDVFRWTLDHVLERGAWVVSLAALEAWWSEREARLGLA